jgi:N-glycosylase/DNA lyase
MLDLLYETEQGVKIPVPIVREYRRIEASYRHRKTWKEMSEDALWSEMCLCILSSNVNYQTAISAHQQLCAKGLIDKERLSKNCQKPISFELSRPIFLPIRKDGSFRRYRFPNIRAANLVRAHDYIYRRNAGLFEILNYGISDRMVRTELAENLPGIGLKEASHFLRNIRFSDSLAIIDTHVLHFLRQFGFGKISINRIGPKEYLKLEEIMRSISSASNFSLSILDMAIWNYMRSH